MVYPTEDLVLPFLLSLSPMPIDASGILSSFIVNLLMNTISFFQNSGFCIYQILVASFLIGVLSLAIRFGVDFHFDCRFSFGLISPAAYLTGNIFLTWILFFLLS